MRACGPTIFSGFYNLNELNLGNNRLKELPEDLWLPLPKTGEWNIFVGVKKLLLQGNQLKGIPDQVMKRLTKLQKLDISGNQMIAMPNLSYSTKLLTLLANGNFFGSISPGTFSANKDLLRLELNNCQLMTIDGLTASETAHLISLKLKGNLLTKFAQDFSFSRRLKYLDLDGNHLRDGIPNSVTHGLPSLEFLYIRDNKMSIFPDLSQNTQLESLYAGNNAFQSIPEYVLKTFNSLPWTRGASAIVSNGDLLEHLPRLDPKLDLEVLLVRNRLSDISSGLHSKSEFFISLGDVYVYARKKPALVVRAAARPFVPVCQRTPQVRDALMAKLGGMPCQRITPKDLEEVRELYLLKKEIKSLQVGDFSGLDNLEKLDLGRNALTELPRELELPSSLRELYLQGNQLEDGIPDPVMHSVPQLEVLDIGENRMRLLPDLNKNPQLEKLFTQGNLFGEVPAGLWKNAAPSCQASVKKLLE